MSKIVQRIIVVAASLAMLILPAAGTGSTAQQPTSTVTADGGGPQYEGCWEWGC